MLRSRNLSLCLFKGSLYFAVNDKIDLIFPKLGVRVDASLSTVMHIQACIFLASQYFAVDGKIDAASLKCTALEFNTLFQFVTKKLQILYCFRMHVFFR